MFDLFQRHRHHALNWLTSHPDECNQVMEDIVKTITFTSKTEQRQLELAQANKDAALAAQVGFGQKYSPLWDKYSTKILETPHFTCWDLGLRKNFIFIFT